MTGRIEVAGRVSGRRLWSDAEKLEILAEAFRPGGRVCDVIARREVSSSLIYMWRKQLREGTMAGAVPSLPVFRGAGCGTESASAADGAMFPRTHPHRAVGRRASERRCTCGCGRTGTGVVGAAMNPVPVPLPTRVFLACGVTDMRKGFDGLAVLVQQVLAQNPHSGALFAFRGRGFACFPRLS